MPARGAHPLRQHRFPAQHNGYHQRNGRILLFSAPSSSITDTLIFSSIGYEVRRVFVSRDQTQEINVNLETMRIMLEEVIVRPGGNPVYRILDSIMVRKGRNNPDNYDAYQYHSTQSCGCISTI